MRSWCARREEEEYCSTFSATRSLSLRYKLQNFAQNFICNLSCNSGVAGCRKKISYSRAFTFDTQLKIALSAFVIIDQMRHADTVGSKAIPYPVDDRSAWEDEQRKTQKKS